MWLYTARQSHSGRWLAWALILAMLGQLLPAPCIAIAARPCAKPDHSHTLTPHPAACCCPTGMCTMPGCAHNLHLDGARLAGCPAGCSAPTALYTITRPPMRTPPLGPYILLLPAPADRPFPTSNTGSVLNLTPAPPDQPPRT